MGKIRDITKLYASAHDKEELFGYVIVELAAADIRNQGISAKRVREIVEAINGYYDKRWGAELDRRAAEKANATVTPPP